MAEAVAEGWPEMQVTAIRQLRVLRGVVLENGKKTVRVVAPAAKYSLGSYRGCGRNYGDGTTPSHPLPGDGRACPTTA